MQRPILRTAIVISAAWLFGCATPPPPESARVIYSDDGISELSAPASWSLRADFGKSATLRIADGKRDSYLLLISYHAREIDPTTLAAFAQKLSSTLRDNLANGRMSGPRARTINGFPAIEYEVAGEIDNTRLVYQSTVLEGNRAKYHHFIAWTAEPAYGANSSAMRDIVNSFRESPTPRRAKARTDLIFKWPTRANVKFELFSKKTKRGDSYEMRGRGVTSIRPHGKGRLLISTDFTSHKLKSNTKDQAKSDYFQNLLKEAATEIPDYVVSTEGDFINVENISAYHRRIEKTIMKGLPAGNPEARNKAQQLVKTLMSEQTLAVLIQDGWDRTVGNWAGGSYVTGQTYEFAAQYQSPALGNQAFPMTVTQKLADRVPCRSGTKADSCVRLEQVSRVSDPGFTEATNRLVRQTVGAEVAVDSVDVVKNVVVIADPKTLQPYDVHMIETKNVVVKANGKSHTAQEVQESRIVYTY